jgi:lysine 6-dehydrogenase
MSYDYAVIGAGRQGTAAACDLVMFGEAARVVLVDAEEETARAAARRVNDLARRRVAEGVRGDASDPARLRDVLRGCHALVSAAHYAVNVGLTELAASLGLHMVDLGGITGVVRRQHAFDGAARASAVTIVPDCGMGPGLNISLAAYVMEHFDRPRDVRIWDGGLPEMPVPPWNYLSTFAMSGLTNEYDGVAYFLRDGAIAEVPCFDGLESLDFAPPVGRLEAFVTSGGLSTAPWTWHGVLDRLENKTLRHPGHCAMFTAFRDLGLLGTDPIDVGGGRVVPRDVFHALLEPRIGASTAAAHGARATRDVGVMRVTGTGERDGRDARFTVELIDRFDAATGFTAMQRLTGWHAAIVAGLAVRGRLPAGVRAVETIPGSLIVAEGRRRGWHFSEHF